MKFSFLAAVAAFLFGSLAFGEDDGFHDLFDGKSLEGWEGDPKLWRIEDRAITGETNDEEPIDYNSFLIWRDGELDDFELKLEYKIRNGNSGVQVRSFEVKNQPFAVGGYQADFEAGPKWSGTIYGERYHGVRAARGKKTTRTADNKITETGETGNSDELQGHIKKDDWNTYHITAKGNTITTRINGHVMAVHTDESADARRSGVLAFQLHKGPAMKVQFRNIRLKRLGLEDKKKVVFVAGKPSHQPRHHEHNAGCLLLGDLLNAHHGDNILATTYRNGWPGDPSAFQNADAVVMFSDGGQRHPAFFHLKVLDDLRARGIGIGTIHYAVEMVPGKSNDTLAACTGGAFEIHYSVNPHWLAKFESFPDHPVANGVKPFETLDEWYFNLRFVPDMKGVTPILSAVPPAETMERPDGHHSGNPEVRKMVAEKKLQHVGWVFQREDGGRGFGTTGAHFHDNWANDDFRKFALNAIAWISKIEIPENGIETPTPDQAQLDANLDPKKTAQAEKETGAETEKIASDLTPKPLTSTHSKNHD